MDMMPWSEKVVITLDSSGEVRSVSDTMTAAECLFTYWPGGEGEAYDNAMKAFAEVFDGSAPPDAARNAFVAAAKEAKVFTLRGSKTN